MTHQLLHPGHVEHVLGFGPFRKVLEALYGPLSQDALASAVFGLYTGLVYLTPIAGGLIADRFIGRTWAVTLGASLMAIGHFLMAFDVSFLLALLCLLLGTGFFKGNISSQVGDLYGPNDPRRADAFQMFLFVVQVAVIFSPLVCGTLGQDVGWHYGFGAAGVGMVLGLIIYLSGRSRLPKEMSRRAGTTEVARPKLERADWQRLALLVALLPVLAVSIVGNNEIFNAYLVWGERTYQLRFFGFNMPITWILSIGSIVSASTIALSVAFWHWYAKRWSEPDELAKMAIGVAISALAVFVVAAAAAIATATHSRVSLGWAVAFEIVNDIGFANVLPVGLALYTRAAPKGYAGIVVGIYYLHLFAGNLLVGKLGGLLGTMPDASFWLLHAGLVSGAAAVLVVMRIAVGRSLAPSYDAPSAAVAQAAE